jgi:hypothetical protein
MARTRSQSSRPHSHKTWMKELAGRVSASSIASLISLAATSFRAARSSRKLTQQAYGFPLNTKALGGVPYMGMGVWLCSSKTHASGS